MIPKGTRHTLEPDDIRLIKLAEGFRDGWFCELDDGTKWYCLRGKWRVYAPPK